MSEANKKTSAQNLAIHEYLQSLLSEVPQDVDEDNSATRAEPITESIIEPAAKPKVEPTIEIKAEVVKLLAEPKTKSVVVGLEQLVAEVPDVISQTVTEVVTETKVETQAQVVQEQEVQAQQDTDEPQKATTAIPDWAETRFQCLLFNVSGLSLAVPLVKLNSVIPWDENITETPNQTDWYLGLVKHLENQIKVIDTALLVMPENRRANLKNSTENRLSHILLVDDYQWGLACSSIGDVIWLNQDEVKWRKNKSSRAWLSGTSLEHLCAIMDTQVFAKMLTESG